MRVNTALLTAGALLALPASAFAHNGIVHSSVAPRALSPWDLASFAGLLLCAATYGIGSYRLAMRGAVHRRVEPVAFALG